MKHELKEKLFEEMLQSALKEHTKNDASELKTEDELLKEGTVPHRFSPDFERKMKRLIGKERRSLWRKLHRKMLQRIAVCTAFAVLVGGTAVMKVDALRVPIFNFFMSLGEKYSVIHIQDTEKPTGISKELNEYLPAYIPEGFFESFVLEDTNSFTIEYKNKDESSLILAFWKTAQGGAVDTEDSIVTEFKIRDYPAYSIQKGERIILIWMPNGHEYNITGNIGKDETIRILESIKKNF